jgi:hypothetical protein
MENTKPSLPDTAITDAPKVTPNDNLPGEVPDLGLRARPEWGTIIGLVAIHALLLAVLVYGILRIVPRLSRIYADFQMKLPLATEVLFAISDWMVSFSFLVPFGVIGILLLDGAVLVALRRQERTRGLAWLWFVLILILLAGCVLGAATAILDLWLDLMEGLSR